MFYLTIGILTRNMIYRTCDLQNRAEMGVANPPRAFAPHLLPCRSSVFSNRDVSHHLTGHNLFADPISALCSNVLVVASGHPSLWEETTALMSAYRCSSEDAESTSQFEPDRSNRSLNETLLFVSRDSNNGTITRLTSNEAGFFLEDSGDDMTTVNHRCVRSPRVGSKEGTRNASKELEIVHIVHAPTIKAKERVFEPETAVKSLSALEKQERTSWLRLREKSLVNLVIRGRSPSTRR